uniref:Lysine-specific demethylase lid n=1 Tax=Cajanus cajan TaxID=3821 RepID=A0A151TUR0_CAJCA|nr:Lysine-specific demethylase lid [Cajanus cajan]
MASRENIKTKRKRYVKVALDSQVGNRNAGTPNNQNVEECYYESEPGPKFSLQTFKKYADEFKRQYFNHKDKNKIMLSNIKAIRQQQWEPSVENIEGEYGRIAQNPTEEIKVLCGNTLEAGVFSSGFPSVSDPLEAYTCPEYLKSGWNLNNILSVSGSLLSLESSEALRNFAPQIHVGMCFSPFSWKVEEHHLYALSYVHLGEPRVWYGIPGRFAVNFETIWKKYLPDLDVRQPNMHDNLGMQLSCSILKAEVSFAPIAWLLHGQNVVELYCEQRRKTLLSYDKLLLGAAREAVRVLWETNLCMKSTSDSLTCKDVYRRNVFLTKALNSRIQSESLKRKFLCTYLVSQRMGESFDVTCKRESLDGKLSAVYKWAKEDLGLNLNSVASKRSKQNPENVSGSTCPSQGLQMKEPIPQTASDEYSKGKRPSQNLQMEESMSQTESDECSMGKRRNLQEILYSSKEKQSELVSGPSKKKQNQVVSQVMRTSGGTHSSSNDIHSTFSDGMKVINSVGTKIDTKAVGAKFTISKKVGEPEVSKVPPVINSRYLSFLQENVLIEVSSDSSSTSSSSDSDNA